MVEKQTELRETKLNVLEQIMEENIAHNRWKQNMKTSGIVHQKTNPYTPEENGLCERFNRTVVEYAKCLFFEADLNKNFWAEAVNTAVYLKNRSPASGLGDMTPFEKWTGNKPDLIHVRVFGSPVMVHVPKIKRQKPVNLFRLAIQNIQKDPYPYMEAHTFTKVNPSTLSHSLLASYLIYLYNVTKLSARTILVHKSTVVTFTKPSYKESLSSQF